MIRAIIFDCFGVLTEDKWHAFRVSLPANVKDRARELMRQWSGGFLTEPQFIAQAAQLTARSPAFIEALITADRAKNTALLNYIATLKPHYKIGLLSNVASDWIQAQFLTPAEQQLFDDIVLSYRVRLTKPDPRIFKLAADRLAVLPKECVFIDDIERYCRGAESAGMKSLVYQDLAKLQNDLEKLLIIS